VYRPIDGGKFEVTLTFQTKKLVANSDGDETEVEMSDYVEVGAFAKPVSGSEYGETLYRERLQLAAGEHTHTFIVDQLPYEAGVDPFALLVDRVIGDNVRRVKAQ